MNHCLEKPRIREQNFQVEEGSGWSGHTIQKASRMRTEQKATRILQKTFKEEYHTILRLTKGQTLLP